MDIVPNEIWWQVMLFLPLQDLQNFIFSSKTFYSIQKNDNFWKEKFNLSFKHGCPDSFIKLKKWKERYTEFCFSLEENFKTFMIIRANIGFDITDRKYWIEFVKKHKDLLEYCTIKMKNDKELVLTAIRSHPNALKHVSLILSEDKEVVMEAVKRDGIALQYAGSNIRYDKEVLLIAVKNNGLVLQYLYHNPAKEFVMEAVKENPMAFKWASDELRNDYEVALLAMKNGRDLLNLDGEDCHFLNNYTKQEDLLYYVGEDLKRDENFVKESVTLYPGLIYRLQEDYYLRRRIILHALKRNPKGFTIKKIGVYLLDPIILVKYFGKVLTNGLLLLLLLLLYLQYS